MPAPILTISTKRLPHKSYRFSVPLAATLSWKNTRLLLNRLCQRTARVHNGGASSPGRKIDRSCVGIDAPRFECLDSEAKLIITLGKAACHGRRWGLLPWDRNCASRALRGFVVCQPAVDQYVTCFISRTNTHEQIFPQTTGKAKLCHCGWQYHFYISRRQPNSLLVYRWECGAGTKSFCNEWKLRLLNSKSVSFPCPIGINATALAHHTTRPEWKATVAHLLKQYRHEVLKHI